MKDALFRLHASSPASCKMAAAPAGLGEGAAAEPAGAGEGAAGAARAAPSPCWGERVEMKGGGERARGRPGAGGGWRGGRYRRGCGRLEPEGGRGKRGRPRRRRREDRSARAGAGAGAGAEGGPGERGEPGGASEEGREGNASRRQRGAWAEGRAAPPQAVAGLLPALQPDPRLMAGSYALPPPQDSSLETPFMEVAAPQRPVS